jgi:hypothetical protein
VPNLYSPHSYLGLTALLLGLTQVSAGPHCGLYWGLTGDFDRVSEQGVWAVHTPAGLRSLRRRTINPAVCVVCVETKNVDESTPQVLRHRQRVQPFVCICVCCSTWQGLVPTCTPLHRWSSGRPWGLITDSLGWQCTQQAWWQQR